MAFLRPGVCPADNSFSLCLDATFVLGLSHIFLSSWVVRVGHPRFGFIPKVSVGLKVGYDCLVLHWKDLGCDSHLFEKILGPKACVLALT